MITTITQSDFHESFKRVNREDNFSREGLDALFKYLTELEDSTGTPIELDVIALCCEYTEATLEVVAGDYFIEVQDVRDFIGRHSTLIPVTESTIIYQVF